MSHSWLQRKRKGELIDLAQKAKLPDADGFLKDDLVELLEAHLNSNESTYGKHADFRDFYGRSGSPVKRERSSPSEALVVTKTRRRTLIKAPSEEPTPEKKALVTRTPRAVSRRVSEVLAEVDIPASPAQLAEVADQSFQVVKSKASDLWDRTQIDQLKEFIRENVSSVAAIQTLILLIEAAGLQYNTLETTAAASLPAEVSKHTGLLFLLVPNFTALLSSDWWAPATLWSLTSWVIPLIFSYFFNLTLRSNTNRRSSDRQYPADPLTFNIVKAILVYSAFRIPTIDASLVGEPGIARVIDYSWGPFSAETVGVVRNNVPGKFNGLQIGALVGVLVSLYDAALKK
ncbi:hypothetical protein BKA66DRAFT_223981 [Pyrenochaeta sp. MPI-SDFR-AT-0127]|nr:hypothetical protein BKA66DRAFT_223981 [Pyrenochaeta sp. MPI-SDFR-AT-0127]